MSKVSGSFKNYAENYPLNYTENQNGNLKENPKENRTIEFNHKAQVTVFIIIGLLLLFAFIFVMGVYNSTQKMQLQGEQERLTVNLFKKEAMRIYVEDCLQDSLEQGLILLGQQGQIWDDQPGGKNIFNEVTGIEFENSRIYYGISNEKYSIYPNAYPCNDQTEAAPHFCKYIHPNIHVGLGDLKLKRETIRQEMESYLANQTVLCVENFTKSNLSKSAKIETTDLSLMVDIQEEGISVKADYPLKFSVGKEEFFQLTTFDFFYPSQFKKLLDSAVTYALERDYRFLNFSYTQEFLESPGYTAYDTYNSLGVKTIRSELSNGDDVFTFTPDIYTVLNNPSPYYFRLARQNRPPALDYVQRYGCPEDPEKGYDYLVIPGDLELGRINIALYAEDPDEDKFNYSLQGASTLFEGNYPSVMMLPLPHPLNAPVSLVPPHYGFHKITAKATDGHGLSDWQDVRLLVDKPIDTNLFLRVPYKDINGSFGEAYIVSTEDPVLVNITYPGKSLAQISEAKVNLNYTNMEGTEAFGFNYDLSPDTQGKNCFTLPWAGEHSCNLYDQYKFINLSQWKTIFGTGDYAHFSEKTSDGKLNLSFSITYCDGELNKSTSASARIIVKECLPHRNPQRPFAYPFQNYEFSNYDFKNNLGNFTGKNTNPFNALEATHSCCQGDPSDVNTLDQWKIAPNTTTCFVDPEPGCHNHNGYGKKMLEVKVVNCDGKRGNVCGGEADYILSNSTSSSSEVQSRLMCGYNGKPANNPGAQCSGISPECQGKPAFALIKGKGWCAGTEGCSYVKLSSDKPLVYLGSKTVPYSLGLDDDALLYVIGNQFLKSGLKSVSSTSHNSKFNYTEGCSKISIGYPCDKNYDGFFSGTCDKDGICGDI